MNDLRASMHPKILENFMILRENQKCWGPSTVEDAVHRVDIEWPEQLIEDEDEANDYDSTYDLGNDA